MLGAQKQRGVHPYRSMRLLHVKVMLFVRIFSVDANRVKVLLGISYRVYPNNRLQLISTVLACWVQTRLFVTHPFSRTFGTVGAETATHDPERLMACRLISSLDRLATNSMPCRWLGARKRLKPCTSRIALPLQNRKGTTHTSR